MSYFEGGRTTGAHAVTPSLTAHFTQRLGTVLGLALLTTALGCAAPGGAAAGAAAADAASSAVISSSDHTRARLPLKPDPAFAHYPVYQGTMGGKPVLLRLGVKPDDPQEMNGEYQYLPNGPVVLIAGARDGKTLTLEESDDGTEISGQWVGFYGDANLLSGERLDNAGANPVDFAFYPAPQ